MYIELTGEHVPFDFHSHTQQRLTALLNAIQTGKIDKHELYDDDGHFLDPYDLRENNAGPKPKYEPFWDELRAFLREY
jgi:hypothetical protein